MATMATSSSSPAPSPSPTPPPNLQGSGGGSQGPSSSPAHHGTSSSSSSAHQHHSTKAGALVSAAKSTLAEQSARLALKHNTDTELLDDLRLYLKTRCTIEQNYATSLAKLNSAHSKRSSSLLSFCAAEDEISDVKTVYTAWKVYQEDIEKHAKSRITVFEQLSSACDQLKAVRSHKSTVSKKCLDSHLKKMQEEIVNSVSEIDKTRKLYFEEEHLAKQARDKEEKIKKRKTGIFSSFANLQTKKERTSAHREASDIQSTQARNDYIMALAAGNAHLGHYYGTDLPNLMFTIDDAVLDKCRSFIMTLLQSERDMVTNWHEVIHRCNETMEHSSADYTNSVFLKDPHSLCITETLTYDFQPCDNDSIDYISLEHNADIALRNEGQKWFSWFCKECRNLNRLSAQLVRVQALQMEGHKTVDVTGSGQVDIETRIDEIRQQIRKCEISKIKARARLQVIRESGAEVEDFENFEAQAAMEMKQQSLDVMDITGGGSLSRTSSMRSNVGGIGSSSAEAKSPVPNRGDTVDSSGGQQQHSHHMRPESSSSAEQLDSPDREVLQLGSSVECTSPAPSSAAYASAASAGGWGAMDYDPTAVTGWDEEPPAVAVSAPAAVGAPSGGAQANNGSGNNNNNNDNSFEDSQAYGEQAATDGFSLVGKQCFVLYAYEGAGEDELSVTEQEIVSVIDASDRDWVRAQNDRGQYGYVPAAYLQEMPGQGDHSLAGVSQPSMGTSLNSTESTSEHHNDRGGGGGGGGMGGGTTTTVSISSPPADSSTSNVFSPPAASSSARHHPGQQQLNSTSSVEEFSQDLPLPPPPPPPPQTGENDGSVYVRAAYDYVATNEEEISFAAGEMIKILDSSTDDGWWTGENQAGAVGHFPSVLVTGGDDDEEEEDEDEDEDEDENEDEDMNDEEMMSIGVPNLPPPLPGSLSMPPPPPPPTSSSAAAPNLPPPPPVLPPPPPVIAMSTDFAESPPDGTAEGTTSLPPPPPPAPMTLMAPQMGVIIQPTPEIECKPMLGSESSATTAAATATNASSSADAAAASTSSSSSNYDREMVNFEEMLAQESEGTSISTSMAIAVQEVSETVTQQAMDDSMREISRRTSTASSYDGSVVEVVAAATAAEAAAQQPSTSSQTLRNQQPNGDIVNNAGGGGGGGGGHQENHHNFGAFDDDVDEDEEDCK